MGYLFENMEKMDIQEERRKTKEARQDAEDAKRWAEKAESRAKHAENRAKEAEDYIKEVKRQADEMRERALSEMVVFLKKLNASKEEAVQKLMEVFAMEQEEAEEKVKLYWTEENTV